MEKPGKKSKNRIELKTIGRILLIICGVLIIAAVVITLFRHFSIQKENQALEEKRKQSLYSVNYYEMNIAGEISPDEINLNNYISLKDFGEFFINDNSDMLEQTIELTYNTGADNKYYIKNNCYSCKIDDESHYYFFGNNKENLPFYLKISKSWDKSEWFILNGFRVPDVRYDIADGITVIKDDMARGLPSRSLSSKDLRRINPPPETSTADAAAVDSYITRYNNGIYVFTDHFEEVKKAKESSDSGYVLVSFKNFNLYQCIGTY